MQSGPGVISTQKNIGEQLRAINVVEMFFTAPRNHL